MARSFGLGDRVAATQRSSTSVQKSSATDSGALSLCCELDEAMDCSQPKLHRDLSFSNWCLDAGTAFPSVHPGACIRGRSSDELSSDSTDSSDAPHERPLSISDWLQVVGAEPQARPAADPPYPVPAMSWHPAEWAAAWHLGSTL